MNNTTTEQYFTVLSPDIFETPETKQKYEENAEKKGRTYFPIFFTFNKGNFKDTTIHITSIWFTNNIFNKKEKKLKFTFEILSSSLDKQYLEDNAKNLSNEIENAIMIIAFS